MSTRLWMILACLMTVGCIVQGVEPIGKVVALEGEATVVRAEEKPQGLKVDSPILLNDRVATKVKSKIQIRFVDDSVVSQGESSEMTIDKYVFDPKKKENVSCSVRLMKGLFRVITGKITEMNPDRFKVSTRMATIGIRGCELGFRIQDKAEDIYIVEITRGQSILVEALDIVKQMGPRVLTVIQEGTTVSLLGGQGMTERPMTHQEAVQLLRESTPQSGGSGNPVQLSQTFESVLEDSASTVAQVTKAKTVSDIEEEVLSNMPPGFSGPTAPPPESIIPSAPVPPNLVSQSTGGPFSDWYWGIWDDGSMSTSLGFNGAYVTASDFQTLVASVVSSGVSLNLTTPASTPGEAGAYLTEGASRVLVTGTCVLNVLIDTAGNAQWAGDFSLQNGALNTLSFSVPLASGRIDNNGVLSLPAWSGFSSTAIYTMRVNGALYPQASLTYEAANGRFVRNASGGPVISGAEGNFTFLHGSAARAEGVFGADLR